MYQKTFFMKNVVSDSFFSAEMGSQHFLSQYSEMDCLGITFWAEEVMYRTHSLRRLQSCEVSFTSFLTEMDTILSKYS